MKKCTICGKNYILKTVRKKLRGKYNPTTKQKKYPNLQWVKLLSKVKTFDGRVLEEGKRIRVCAKCIKKLAKTR